MTYSVRPAAFSASPWSRYVLARETLPPRKSKTIPSGAPTGAPLPVPRPSIRPSARTRSPRSRNSLGTARSSLPGAFELHEIRLESRPPSVAAALDDPSGRRQPLKIRGPKPNDRVNVTPVVGVDDGFRYSHVLPRHRLSPSLCGATAGRLAGPTAQVHQTVGRALISHHPAEYPACRLLPHCQAWRAPARGEPHDAFLPARRGLDRSCAHQAQGAPVRANQQSPDSRRPPGYAVIVVRPRCARSPDVRPAPAGHAGPDQVQGALHLADGDRGGVAAGGREVVTGRRSLS